MRVMSRESLKKTCDEAPEYHQIQGHFGIPLRPSSKGRVPALLLEINIDPQFRRANHPKRGSLSHHATLNLFISSPTTQVVHFKSIGNDLKVCVTYEFIPWLATYLSSCSEWQALDKTRDGNKNANCYQAHERSGDDANGYMETLRFEYFYCPYYYCGLCHVWVS